MSNLGRENIIFENMPEIRKIDNSLANLNLFSNLKSNNPLQKY
jgi:hypothetical protein